MTKLHLGCGNKYLQGYINVDIRGDQLDLRWDLTKIWPWADKSTAEIQSYHVLEHLNRVEGLFFLREAYRVLVTDGLLILELPDASQAAADWLNGVADREASLWGRQRHEYDYHKWGYGPMGLRKLMEGIGFKHVVAGPGTDNHAKYEPCFRIVGAR